MGKQIIMSQTLQLMGKSDRESTINLINSSTSKEIVGTDIKYIIINED